MKGTDIGWLLVAGMAGVGAASVLAPKFTSTAYGSPQRNLEGKALMRAMGMRDLGLASILGATLVIDPRLAIIPAITTAAVSAGDLLNAATLGRPRAVPMLTHLTGITLGALATARLLKAG